jgi:hypothetical protein
MTAPSDWRADGERKGLVVYRDLVQGTEEWSKARLGLLTASEMHLIVTPTLKVASNEKERAHLYELLAQRISQYVEPFYESFDMARGAADEAMARFYYSEHIAPVEEVGFITNDRWGFTLGYSPDGLVGNDGLVEIKSRRQKFQVQTIIENTVPPEHIIQCQTGLLVSEREWIDFVSYRDGLPMIPIRVYPDKAIHEAIINAAGEFENRLTARIDQYKDALAKNARLVPTERRVEEEIRV